MSGSGSAEGHAAPDAPSLQRRLACAIYEGVLLFGVVMIAGYLYSSLTQQKHALVGTTGLQAFLFTVLGIYFGWFWSRSGQTLAMKTWHLRVARSNGLPLSQARALVRYLACWLWFLPPLAFASLSQVRGLGAKLMVLAAGLIAYAGLALLRRDRQFLHDVICDTRVSDFHPVPLAASTDAK
jgi:uncharacterized RDD family membrane protein YckC